MELSRDDYMKYIRFVPYKRSLDETIQAVIAFSGDILAGENISADKDKYTRVLMEVLYRLYQYQELMDTKNLPGIKM